MDDYSNDAQTTGRLAVGGSQLGRIDFSGDEDWFKVTLDGDRAYGLVLAPVGASQVFGLELQIADARGGAAVFSTIPVGGSRDRLDQPLTNQASGDYYFKVQGLLEGDYKLSLRELADDQGNSIASARNLTAAAPVTAKFDYDYDREYYKIAASKGNKYTVTFTLATEQLSQAPKVTPEIGLYDQAGNLLATATGEAGLKTLSYEPSAAGNLYVRVVSSGYNLPAGAALEYKVALDAAPIPDHTAPTMRPEFGNVKTNMVNGAVIIRFSEDVIARNGTITLTHNATGTTETFDVKGGGVAISGSVLEIRPTHAILAGAYTAVISEGAVADAAGNGVAQGTLALAVRGFVPGGTTPERLAQDYSYLGHPTFIDGMVYAGTPDGYTITGAGAGASVTVRRPDGYTDTLLDYDRILFTGSNDILALTSKGAVGQAYRLYEAAFNRAPDKAGLGFWIYKLDGGAWLPDVAQGFLASAEFKAAYGADTSNSRFVETLYQNILNRPGEAEGLAYWNKTLDAGAARADVLAAFSESAENVAGTTALIGQTIVYTGYYG